MLKFFLRLSSICFFSFFMSCKNVEFQPYIGSYKVKDPVLSTNMIPVPDFKGICDVPYFVDDQTSSKFLEKGIDSLFIEFSKYTHLNFHKTTRFSPTLLTIRVNNSLTEDITKYNIVRNEIVVSDNNNTTNNSVVFFQNEYYNYLLTFAYNVKGLPKPKEFYISLLGKTISKLIKIPYSSDKNSFFSDEIPINNPITKLSSEDISYLGQYYSKNCPYPQDKPTITGIVNPNAVGPNSFPVNYTLEIMNGSPITNHGICISASRQFPDTTDIHIKNSSYPAFYFQGSSTLSFYKFVNKLKDNQTYYVRTYAQNNNGLGFSTPFTIKTSSIESDNTKESFQLQASTTLLGQYPYKFASFQMAEKVFYSYDDNQNQQPIIQLYNFDNNVFSFDTSFPRIDTKGSDVKGISLNDKGYFFYFMPFVSTSQPTTIKIAEYSSTNNNWKSYQTTFPLFLNYRNMYLFVHNNKIHICAMISNLKAEIYEYDENKVLFNKIADINSNNPDFPGTKFVYIQNKLYYYYGGGFNNGSRTANILDLTTKSISEISAFKGNYGATYLIFPYLNIMNFITFADGGANTGINNHEFLQYDLANNRWLSKKNPFGTTHFNNDFSFYNYRNQGYMIAPNSNTKTLSIYKFLP